MTDHSMAELLERVRSKDHQWVCRIFFCNFILIISGITRIQDSLLYQPDTLMILFMLMSMFVFMFMFIFVLMLCLCLSWC